MLEYYQQFLHALLGWADAPLRTLVHHLQERINVRMNLSPGWKHVFVLMWLYFSSDAKGKWRFTSDAKTNWSGRKSFTTFCVILGGIIALIASIALGIETTTPIANLTTAAVPMVALFTYELLKAVFSATFSISTPSFDANGKTWREIFIYCFFNYSLPTFSVTVLVMAMGAIAYIKGLVAHEIDLGIVALTACVVALAIYWLGRGAFLATYDRQNDELWLHRFKRSGSTYLGTLTLTTMSGAALFVILNAGLKLVGL
jgi:hypothetical protein